MKNYYSTIELAKLLGISRQAVLKKIKNGQIKAEKIGRNYFIPGKDFKDSVREDLTDKIKEEIGRGVAKVIKEYGDTLKMLGNE